MLRQASFDVVFQEIPGEVKAAAAQTTSAAPASRSFVSQSAVISADWISSGITVMRALPLSVGSSTLVFLVPLRSRKPFCTSFSMVAALVAGVPTP